MLFIHSAGPQNLQEGSGPLVHSLMRALQDEYEIRCPTMPAPEHPQYMIWKEQLTKEWAAMAGEVILVGHSLGGSVLLKYLSEEPCPLPVSALLLIATPFWGAPDWEIEEYALQKNFAARLPVIPYLFLYQSKDDEVVPVDHLSYYAQELPRARIRLLEGYGHTYQAGLPELVDDLKSINHEKRVAH